MNDQDIYAKLVSLEGAPAGLTEVHLQGDDHASVRLMGSYERFLDLSTELTAFSKFELRGTGQGVAYFATLIQVLGLSTMDELLDCYELVRGGQGSLQRDLLGNEKLGPVARNLIKLWFSGSWYQLPRAWSEKFGPAPRDVTHVVSANAYVEGLLWTTIGAHPAGAKAPGYGSWAYPPVIPGIDS